MGQYSYRLYRGVDTGTIVPSFSYTGQNAIHQVIPPFGIPIFTAMYGSIISGLPWVLSSGCAVAGTEKTPGKGVVLDRHERFWLGAGHVRHHLAGFGI